jgi:hypothetical protein
MKKILAIGLITTLAGLAYAQTAKVKTVTLANVAAEPSGTSTGLSAQVKGPDGKQWALKTISVTAKQPDDGGLEFHDLNTVAFRAWKYTLNAQLADAGTLYSWSRLPQLDLKYDSDAGAGAVAYAVHNNGVTLYVEPPMLPPGSLISYTGHSGATVDAGTAVFDLILEGVYAPRTPQ